MTQETTINNLSIVWQEQSWSVLAPDGRVLGRFADKFEAVKYAKANTDYVTESTTDDDFIEFQDDIFNDTPPQKKKKNSLAELIKNDHTDDIEYIMPTEGPNNPAMIFHNIRRISFLGCTVIILIVASLCYMLLSWVFGQDYSAIGDTIANSSNNLNWLGLGVLGLIVVIVISALKDSMEEGCLSGCASIFFLIIGISLCNSCGLLEKFVGWVF